MIEQAEATAGEWMRARLGPSTLEELAREELIRMGPILRRLPRRLDRMANQIERGNLRARVSLFSDPHDEHVVTKLVNRTVLALAGGNVGVIVAMLEPDYRHTSMDIYLDPALRGRGIGVDALRTLARHLIVDHGHHRLEIDPAVDNAAAIRCYTKVGFRPVGVMRKAERGNDGTWHDSLLMDMLADELTE